MESCESSIGGQAWLSQSNMEPAVNDVLFSLKGNSRSFDAVIRCIHHMILVIKQKQIKTNKKSTTTKTCIYILNYSTPLEIKSLFGHDINANIFKKKLRNKSNKDRRKQRMEGIVFSCANYIPLVYMSEDII